MSNAKIVRNHYIKQQMVIKLSYWPNTMHNMWYHYKMKYMMYLPVFCVIYFLSSLTFLLYLIVYLQVSGDIIEPLIFIELVFCK